MEENLKISIVTPSYNQGQFIEQTIKSVLNQDYKNYEHIIIDGGSTDNTIDILKKYKHLIWISEKDAGQSNAINKGFSMAKGEIFAWLNSDDYYEENIFKSIATYFKEHKECNFLYGNITYVDKNGKSVAEIRGEEITFESLLKNPDLIRQPSFFWRKENFVDNGGLDESLDLVMDYDLFLKFTKSQKPGYINKYLSYYRFYDETKTNVNRKKQATELYKVMKRYSARISLGMYWFLFKRYFGLFDLFAVIRKIPKILVGRG
jgi:glycosyltransferase involved in cell wall biosynthesis